MLIIIAFLVAANIYIENRFMKVLGKRIPALHRAIQNTDWAGMVVNIVIGQFLGLAVPGLGGFYGGCSSLIAIMLTDTPRMITRRWRNGEINIPITPAQVDTLKEGFAFWRHHLKALKIILGIMLFPLWLPVMVSRKLKQFKAWRAGSSGVAASTPPSVITTTASVA